MRHQHMLINLYFLESFIDYKQIFFFFFNFILFLDFT